MSDRKDPIRLIAYVLIAVGIAGLVIRHCHQPSRYELCKQHLRELGYHPADACEHLR